MNKAISTPLAIIIIIVCAVLVGGIVVWQSLGMPKEEEVSEVLEELPEDEIADWKTYRNEEHGFEMRYPLDCLINNINNPSLIPYASSDFKGVERIHILETDNCNIRIEIYTNPNNLSPDEWLDHFSSNISPVGLDLSWKIPILISGASGFRGLLGCCANYFKAVVLSKGNKIYMISETERNMFSVDYAEEKDLWLSDNWVDSDDIYVKMLSTFKFLE